uniref:Uncharacterized protein n=1 Tax=Arion vulgaris TaxID=1028688 RepID=A0A0B7AUP3_9EUPU
MSVISAVKDTRRTSMPCILPAAVVEKLMPLSESTARPYTQSPQNEEDFGITQSKNNHGTIKE